MLHTSMKIYLVVLMSITPKNARCNIKHFNSNGLKKKSHFVMETSLPELVRIMSTHITYLKI